jgi:hypothetical protein
MNWAGSYPEKRRALAQLGVSEEITLKTRAAAHKTMAGIAELLEQIRSSGPIRKAPMGFVVAIMNSVAEATIDFMAQDSMRGSTAKRASRLCGVWWPNFALINDCLARHYQGTAPRLRQSPHLLAQRGPAPRSLDVCDNCLCWGRFSNVVHDHRKSIFCQSLCDRASDSTRGSRDNRAIRC